mmetsp:Transcript_36101/g.55438  ORF Transcript_36101/g.55438 Transcript_36101/m.55438 type:complete len:82 (-) Transcript_36101:1196-1441(-)
MMSTTVHYDIERLRHQLQSFHLFIPTSPSTTHLMTSNNPKSWTSIDPGQPNHAPLAGILSNLKCKEERKGEKEEGFASQCQ